MASEQKSPPNSSLTKPGTLKLPSRTSTILAHNKIALHSLKYLSNSILGVLIGIRYKGNNNTTNVHVIDAIPILHNSFSAMVVELAFLQIETWLSSLNKSNKRQRPLQIVGVYFANENVDDRTKSTAAILIASQLIKDTSKNGVLLCQVDNERIDESFAGNDTCLDWYCLGNNGNPESDRDWKEIPMAYTKSGYCDDWGKDDNNNNKNKKSRKSKHIPNITKEDIGKYEEYLYQADKLVVINDNNTELGRLVKKEKELLVCDFEDHLDDLAKDWRNIF